MITMIKNYKNRLRLTEVIVKNKISRFYGSVCIRSYCSDCVLCTRDLRI